MCMRGGVQVLADVSEAVHRLIASDMRGLATETQLRDNDTFRLQHCYTEATCEVLARHEASLRAVYDALTVESHGPLLAVAGGPEGATKQPSRRLLGIIAWLDFVRLAELVGADLSLRDATLAFQCSRMCVVDNSSEVGALRETHINFEG